MTLCMTIHSTSHTDGDKTFFFNPKEVSDERVSYDRNLYLERRVKYLVCHMTDLSQ